VRTGPFEPVLQHCLQPNGFAARVKFAHRPL
jgi:hypothetical protein